MENAFELKMYDQNYGHYIILYNIIQKTHTNYHLDEFSFVLKKYSSYFPFYTFQMFLAQKTI